MSVVTTVCLAVLAASALLCLWRLVRAASIVDRVLALDTLLIVVAVGVAVGAAGTRSGVYLDALLVVALVAFIGTTAVARLVERRGSR